MVGKGGLPPAEIEWHSTGGGKPPFPTMRFFRLNHFLCLCASVADSVIIYV